MISSVGTGRIALSSVVHRIYTERMLNLTFESHFMEENAAGDYLN
jgi:hypothetical protein